MKTLSTAIATLLLGAASTVPLGAQFDITAEGVSDPSVLGQTLVFDSEGIGQRVTKRLYLHFDSGDEASLTLRNVQIRGATEFSYQLNGVTGLPTSIRGELTLDLFVTYHPRTPGPANATLELTLRVGNSETDPDLAVYTVNLIGRVPSYSLTYTLPGGAPRAVPVSGLIDFGHKPTFVTTEATVVLTNQGSGPGTIQGVTTSGSSMFSLISPPGFPYNLEPGRSVSLEVGFTPTATLNFSGALSVDLGSSINEYVLKGIGGDLLRFRLLSYAHDSSVGVGRTIKSGNPIVFGQGSARVEVVGTNIRQSSQPVDSIRVTGPFAITAPTLPLTLGPSEEFVVRVEPGPAAGRDATGNLIVDDAIFPLSLDTPMLPNVTFTSLGGTLRAGEEVDLGLNLSRAYPVDVTGTMSLELESVEGQSDPALRWSSGGRQVSFRIAAGETAAVIAGTSRTISFFASAAPGTVTVKARFAAYPWGIDLTPPTEPQVQFTVELATLPPVQFTRTGGQVRGGDEVSLGLSLASPFSEGLNGTLQLTFEGADAGAASGPWAGSGLQVSFRIGAGNTAAMFADGSPTTTFTAPTAEGRVTVTARFVGEDSGLDVTPDDPPQVEFTVRLADLPGVQFTGAGGTVTAGDEVELGLSLAQAHSAAIAGTLRMTFEAADAGTATGPWAGAGLQVSFRIARGETQAMFADASAMTSFTAPAVVGRVIVTAQFVEESSGLDVTPEDPPQFEFTVVVAKLPEVRFTRSGGMLRGGQEVELGLALAEAFRDSIEGTLRLTFDGTGAVSGPWAGGGQQLSFRIAAGATAATFADGSAKVAFRAPTAEGRVTAAAHFASEESGTDITPEEVPSVEFAVQIDQLPAVTFSQAGGTVGAAEQVGLSLELASAYPTDIVGALTLSFETRAFANDPSVQWATGGRQALFLIPAGSTAAAFAGNVSTNAFQTGTVAGEIILSSVFYSVPDGVANRVANPEAFAGAAANITPDEAPELQFSVMEAAPVLRSVVLGSTGQGGFALQVTGFSTTRSVSSLSFSFSGAAGADLRTPTLQADVAEKFTTYYAGNQSVSFGSQFTATVSFTLEEGVFEDLNGVSVTATNGSGESNSVSVSLN